MQVASKTYRLAHLLLATCYLLCVFQSRTTMRKMSDTVMMACKRPFFTTGNRQISRVVINLSAADNVVSGVMVITFRVIQSLTSSHLIIASVKIMQERNLVSALTFRPSFSRRRESIFLGKVDSCLRRNDNQKCSGHQNQ